MILSPATYKILYNKKNITKDISDHLLSISYTDKVTGETDELEIVVEDTDGLWQNAWYPTKGDSITAEIENNGRVLACGNFILDEIEMNSSRSSGDTINIKALAAGITKKLRTKRSTAHENKNLREIVNTIAAANGLTVKGTIDTVIFERVTQYNQTDVAFLQQLAHDYGYVFSIRDNVLTFTDIYQLEGRSHIVTLDKTDLTGWAMKDKTSEVYKQASVRHHSPKKNKTIDYDQYADDPDFTAEDILQLKTKAENTQQAGAKAKSHLHRANSKESTGTISTPGNPLLVAGINFELTGMGTLSGIYHIINSTHQVDRSGGYVTSAEIKRVKKIDKSKWKAKGKK